MVRGTGQRPRGSGEWAGKSAGDKADRVFRAHEHFPVGGVGIRETSTRLIFPRECFTR